MKYFVLFFALVGLNFVFGQSDSLAKPRSAIGLAYYDYTPGVKNSPDIIKFPKYKLEYSILTDDKFKLSLNIGVLYRKSTIEDNTFLNKKNFSESTFSICAGAVLAKQFFYRSLVFDIGFLGEYSLMIDNSMVKNQYDNAVTWRERTDVCIDPRVAAIGSVEYRLKNDFSFFVTAGLGVNKLLFGSNYVADIEAIGFSSYNLFGVRYLW